MEEFNDDFNPVEENSRFLGVIENQPDDILRFFQFGHLSPPLAELSSTFANQALTIIAICPRNPERTVALRKLLEAKDAAVRAYL